MKKRYDILNLCTLWLLMAVVIVGCADEDLENSSSPVTGGSAYFKLQLNALSTDIGEDFESDIHSIRIIAYKSGTYTSPQCNYYVDALSANKTAQTEPIEVVAGKIDFYIIVNETSDMNLAGEYITVSDIQSQIQWYGSLTQSVRNKSLTMYSELLSKEIPVGHDEFNPFIVEDNVSRIMAKVTLSIQNITHKEDVLLETAQIKSLPNKSFLAPSIYDCINDSLKLSDSMNLVTTDKETYDSVSFYIPEILLKDKAKRAYIEIKGKARGTVNCTYKISLGEGLKNFISEAQVENNISSLSAKDFSMNRNTHYKINVNDIKGYGTNQLAFVLNVLPWNQNLEDIYDGGVWVQQPSESKRIARLGTAEFKAEFRRTTHGEIEYIWMVNRYPNGLVQPEVIKEIKDSISITTVNGVSTLKYLIAEPDMSGEIYCIAAAKGSAQYRETKHVTFLVIGDWVVSKGRFPEMNNWTPPARNIPMGTSYLLRDGRDGKVYRTKLMADGNWWMIQDLAYGNPVDINTFLNNCSNTRVLNLIGVGSYGVAIKSTNMLDGYPTGGLLYNSIAAIQREQATTVDDNSDKDVGRLTEYIQGLCPNGWHFPANMNGVYQLEWVNLLRNANMNQFSASDFMRFTFFDSHDFNAYTYQTYNEDYFKKNIAFHGGYMAYRDKMKPKSTSMGVFTFYDGVDATGTEFYGIIYNSAYFLADDFPAPIRCVLDDSRKINKK